MAVLVVVGFSFYRGSRRLKKIEQFEAMLNNESPNVKIGKAVYHGGFPPMPRPAHVSVGISEEYIVFYDENGVNGRINFNQFIKIDKFTTRKEPDLKGRSLILYGPLVPIIFTAKIKHFITINYVDVNNEENNIVFEIRGIASMQQMFERINQGWCEYKRDIQDDKRDR